MKLREGDFVWHYHDPGETPTLCKITHIDNSHSYLPETIYLIHPVEDTLADSKYVTERYLEPIEDPNEIIKKML